MAWIYSTGAINYLSGGSSTRKMFSDFALDIYGGAAPPASADAAATGTKLLRVSVGSGAITSTMRSVAEMYSITIASRTNSGTIKATVTIDGNGGVTTSAYTVNTTSPDDSDFHLLVNFCRFLEDAFPQLQAIPIAATGLVFVVKCKIDGLALTIANGGGSISLGTPTELQAASRSSIYTLQFGPPTVGVISKTSDVWSGVGLAAGVATYGRLVLPTDDGTLSSTQIRAQGDVSTSGTEITMSNTTVTYGATSTIDGASITKPTGA